MKKLAFFDIENTIIDGFITSGYYLFLSDKNLTSNWVQDEFNKINSKYKTGDIDYNTATDYHLDLYARAVKGFTSLKNKELQKEYVGSMKPFSWVEGLFRFLTDNNFESILVSAAENSISEIVMSNFKASSCYGSSLEIKGDKYTGKVINVLNSREKRKVVRRIIDENGGPTSVISIGFGDSSGDVPMLELADKAFLVNPRERSLLELAEEKRWVIVKSLNQIVGEVEGMFSQGD